jgi:sulfate/thiosulfate transport system permease protein
MARELNEDPLRLQPRRATTESRRARAILIVVALAYLAFFLVLPLIAVFTEAMRNGPSEFFAALVDPEAASAIKLTLLVAAIAVPLNLIFGIAASWAIAKYEFKGKAFLTTLIDLPFSVSPVISGLVFVLLFGSGSLLGPIFKSWGIQVIFAVPGIVLATVFVTFPFVARELIPLMQEQGTTDIPACDAAQYQVGPALWRPSLQRTRHG